MVLGLCTSVTGDIFLSSFPPSLIAVMPFYVGSKRGITRETASQICSQCRAQHVCEECGQGIYK